MAAAKTKASAQINAVLGSDESEVKRVAKDLAAQLTPEGDFATDIIDGVAANADDAAGSEEGRRRLEKEEGLPGDFVAEFGGVVAVVAADTEDLGGSDGGEEVKVGEGPGVEVD